MCEVPAPSGVRCCHDRRCGHRLFLALRCAVETFLSWARRVSLERVRRHGFGSGVTAVAFDRDVYENGRSDHLHIFHLLLHLHVRSKGVCHRIYGYVVAIWLGENSWSHLQWLSMSSSTSPREDTSPSFPSLRRLKQTVSWPT